MREILFRGKRVDNGEWIYGDIGHRKSRLCDIHTIGICDQYGNYIQVEIETVCQFTGLLDKNRKKIFEGDIIQDGKDIVTVEWDEKFATWALLKRGWMYKHFFGEAIDSKDCEVIGNINDNPELLENK